MHCVLYYIIMQVYKHKSSNQWLSCSFDCWGHFSARYTWQKIGSGLKLWLTSNLKYMHISSQFVCTGGWKLPVELIDVLYVSKQGTDLLWPDGEVTHVNNVGQVVLENRWEWVTHKVIRLYKEVLSIFGDTLSQVSYKHFQILTSRGSINIEKQFVLSSAMYIWTSDPYIVWHAI